MRISIFGLGYVGCVTATCLAQQEHQIVGVDINPHKVRLIETGHSPISEPGLDDLLGKVVERGLFRVTTNPDQAVQDTDVSLICVGTPSNHNGCVNLNYIEKVCAEIGESLGRKPSYHVVVVRSTVLPGTVQKRLIPILEHHSGRLAGQGFGVCMNPEFLREGSAIKDFYNPGLTVIGQIDQKSGDIIKRLYEKVNSQIIQTSLPVAEMIKYTSNTYHALKITFANEIGTLCKTEGIDGQKVMEIFCVDQQLNISSAYLKPGFAFGGSCLPKDVRALAHWAKERDVDAPVLASILPSNRYQIERAIEMVEGTKRNKIGVLGLSFKAATDDVRESPTIAMIETLIGRGYQVAVFDEIVDPEKLIGGNRIFLEKQMPHIASIIRRSMEEVIQEVEVVVIANGSSMYEHALQLLRDDQILIDLVGSIKGQKNLGERYDGICW